MHILLLPILKLHRPQIGDIPSTIDLNLITVLRRLVVLALPQIAHQTQRVVPYLLKILWVLLLQPCDIPQLLLRLPRLLIPGPHQIQLFLLEHPLKLPRKVHRHGVSIIPQVSHDLLARLEVHEHDVLVEVGDEGAVVVEDAHGDHVADVGEGREGAQGVSNGGRQVEGVGQFLHAVDVLVAGLEAGGHGGLLEGKHGVDGEDEGLGILAALELLDVVVEDDHGQDLLDVLLLLGIPLRDLLEVGVFGLEEEAGGGVDSVGFVEGGFENFELFEVGL